MTLPQVPALPTAVPGAPITSALWNAVVGQGLALLLNPPLFSGYQQAAAQPIAAGTWTPATIDTTTVDTYGGHSTTNPTRYTAQIPGWYECTGAVCFSNAQTTGFRTAMFQVNGNRYLGSQGEIPAVPDFSCPVPATTPIFLNAGDYAELAVFSSVATTLSVALGDLRTRFNVRWVHA